MRRYVQILGLIVLALAAGGWGSMAAASLCPHMNGVAARAGRAETLKADDASCHEKPRVVESKSDCHGPATGKQAGIDIYSTRASAADACAHCLSRPESPVSTAIARPQAEQKRTFQPPVSEAPLLQAPPVSFAPPVLYRQGAPPGSPTPRHLLIGLLLI